MRAGLVLSVCLSVCWWTSASSAASLTCEEFKRRLSLVIAGDGDNTPQVGDYTLGFEDDDTGKQYEWGNIEALSGTLKCGPHDAFETFFADFKSDGKDSAASLTLGQFRNLSAATVCVLSASNSEGCEAFASQMFSIAGSQLQSRRDSGQKEAVGSSAFALFRGVDAQLDMHSPAVASWTIGSSGGKPMDQKRLPLQARRLDPH